MSLTRIGRLLCGLAMAIAAPVGAYAASEPAVPYWGSLRAAEVNLRVGPGEDYRINWVYHRQHLPMKVLRVMQGWRLVQDQAGSRGWMLVRLLSHERHAIVTRGDPVPMRADALYSAPLLWRLAPGVVVKLDDCTAGWCHIEVEDRAGYVAADRLWGAGAL